MSLFKKIFGSGKSDGSEERGRFMPDEKTPTDERFVMNFTENGGKFIYCESEEEVQKYVGQIIGENIEKSNDFRIFYPNSVLSKRFMKYKDYFTNSLTIADGYISECENLIADDGSILFTSRQIGHKKVKELPKTLIICATTSQLVDNVSNALQAITHKNSNGEKPTNISAFKSFKEHDDNFLNYGSSPKQTYLLLLEDLI